MALDQPAGGAAPNTRKKMTSSSWPNIILQPYPIVTALQSSTAQNVTDITASRGRHAYTDVRQLDCSRFPGLNQILPGATKAGELSITEPRILWRILCV
jgi:hypothetical protein